MRELARYRRPTTLTSFASRDSQKKRRLKTFVRSQQAAARKEFNRRFFRLAVLGEKRQRCQSMHRQFGRAKFPTLLILMGHSRASSVSARFRRKHRFFHSSAFVAETHNLLQFNELRHHWDSISVPARPMHGRLPKPRSPAPGVGQATQYSVQARRAPPGAFARNSPEPPMTTDCGERPRCSMTWRRARSRSTS